MKFQITLLLAILFSFNVKAQDDHALFQMIENAGSTISSMECEIDNIRLKSGEEHTKHGMLYYQTDDKLATYFDNEDYAIFCENKVKINIGIFRGSFRTNRDNIFNSLSSLLFCAIQGKCVQLAENNDYDYSIEEKGDTYWVNFDSRKQSSFAIGYKNVVLVYGADDFRLRSIAMTDYKDVTNTFNLSKPKYGIAINADKFKQ